MNNMTENKTEEIDESKSEEDIKFDINRLRTAVTSVHSSTALPTGVMRVYGDPIQVTSVEKPETVQQDQDSNSDTNQKD